YQFLPCQPATLPFVVSAYDPPQRPEHVAHPNGAVSVACVRMGVAAEDRVRFDALISEDRWLSREPATRTGVLAVELNGLKDELDGDKLHGAVLVPCEASTPLHARPAPASSAASATLLDQPKETAWLKIS
ncbi:MAG TPA: hypothetical protein VGC79_18685, partial [Polyangiaceae bacterium]